MVASIAKLPLAEKTARAARKSRRQHKADRRQMFAAAGIGVVASTLTVLSLTHLAHGISIVTAAPAWESWAMAIGIDLGFVALEGAQLTSTSEKLRREVIKYTKPAIIGTLSGSAVMNAFAFSSQTSGWMTGAAIVLGVAIPSLIYALTRIGGAMYIDSHNK
jgi:hypothetical protein